MVLNILQMSPQNFRLCSKLFKNLESKYSMSEVSEYFSLWSIYWIAIIENKACKQKDIKIYYLISREQLNELNNKSWSGVQY